MTRGRWVMLGAVVVGGFIGTGLRAIVAELVSADGSGEWLHLILVNTVGAFALAWWVASRRTDQSSILGVLVTVGLLGSFTTFSGVTVEFVEGVRSGEVLLAAAGLAVSLVVGVAAAIVGRVAAR